MGKYDSIRAEFVAGTMTLRELATAHGESYDGLRHAAARGDWSAQREKHASEVESEAAARAVDRCAAWNAGDIATAEKLRAAVQMRLAALEGAELQGAELRALTGAAEGAQRMARLAMGMNTDAHQITTQAPWREFENLSNYDIKKELEARGLPVQLFELGLERAARECASQQAVDELLREEGEYHEMPPVPGTFEARVAALLPECREAARVAWEKV